ncbi:aldo/keto reductase [Thalassotalea euphylliae]|uniref:Aldo/keto reductase n=1 Tax=Thalassotalea euphylliae TaxID=1655234 RepID=A0A3E0TNB4_9GAMM|nr:aldo/keto reductase [Thalassotalea euphylliae]REL26046.1 aldo/keto reductase [Thalassotalea euphylliae]
MKLALGTVQFGLDYGISNQSGQVNSTEVEAILQQAHDAGITLLDSASVYGNSEQVLGQLNISQRFELVTKIPKLAHNTTSIMPHIEQSLRLLKRDQLDAVLFHHADDLISHTKRSVFYQELAALKQQEVVSRIGVSLYQPEQWQLLKNQYQLDLLQVPVNVLDQRFVSSSLLTDYQKHTVKLHCRSAFLQGLLLMPANQRPSYFQPYQDQLARFDRLVKQFHCLPLVMCLALFHVLDTNIKANQNIDDNIIEQVVVGCCSSAQLHEIVRANQIARTININPQPLSELASDIQALINPSLWQLGN